LIDISTFEVPPGYKLVRMAATDIPVLQALDSAWAEIRAADSRIPSVTFDLQPGRPSSHATIEWDVAPIIVMNLKDADRKLTGREILPVLLHHAAHAATFGSTKATEGWYHGTEFAEAAKLLGLKLGDRRPGLGYLPEGLAPGSITRYRTAIDRLDRAIAAWKPEVMRKHDRGPVPFACQCDPPRRLRMNKGVADKGDVICSICGGQFVRTS
jgi:hypothetical protein